MEIARYFSWSCSSPTRSTTTRSKIDSNNGIKSKSSVWIELGKTIRRRIERKQRHFDANRRKELKLTLAVKGVGGRSTAPVMPITAVARDSLEPPPAGARHRDEPPLAAWTPEVRSWGLQRAPPRCRSTAPRAGPAARVHRRGAPRRRRHLLRSSGLAGRDC